MEIKKILVVVASSVKAHYYIAHGSDELINLGTLEHPDGRLKDHDFTTKDHDVNTYPYETKNSKKEHDKQVFSKIVIEKLETLLREEHLDKIYLFAEPKFLGELNKHTANKHHLDIKHIGKDLVNADMKLLLKSIHDAGSL